MKFWKEHAALRLVLILLSFGLGLTLTFIGWDMTGKLAGLGWMLLGIALLLAALYLYNRPFQDPHHKEGRKKQ